MQCTPRGHGDCGVPGGGEDGKETEILIAKKPKQGKDLSADQNSYYWQITNLNVFEESRQNPKPSCQGIWAISSGEFGIFTEENRAPQGFLAMALALQERPAKPPCRVTADRGTEPSQ